MLSFIQHTLTKPFLEVFIHSFKHLDCIEAISAKILSCSASRVEQKLSYFLMSTVKAKDVRESGEQVHYRGGGG